MWSESYKFTLESLKSLLPSLGRSCFHPRLVGWSICVRDHPKNYSMDFNQNRWEDGEWTKAEHINLWSSNKEMVQEILLLF